MCSLRAKKRGQNSKNKSVFQTSPRENVQLEGKSMFLHYRYPGRTQHLEGKYQHQTCSLLYIAWFPFLQKNVCDTLKSVMFRLFYVMLKVEGSSARCYKFCSRVRVIVLQQQILYEYILQFCYLLLLVSWIINMCITTSVTHYTFLFIYNPII